MSDNLSQEDIDRLLSGMSGDSGMPDMGGGADAFASSGAAEGNLSHDEKDTLGELCNISMGSSATTLSEILNTRVEITTPTVMEFHDISEILSTQEESTLVEIRYLSGLDYSVLFLLKNTDVAVIADLMMGGTGMVETPEIGEIQLSAVGEAMNQMMGTAATNLASIFNSPVDISPPNTKSFIPGQAIELPHDVQQVPVIGVVFKLTVGELIDSEMLQLMSIESAKKQISLFMGSVDSLLQGVPEAHAAPAYHPGGMDMGRGGRMFGGTQNQPHGGGQHPGMQQGPVTIQPAMFSSFDNTRSLTGQENQNLELVLDVGLKLTVELGRAELPIKKVLELTRGSVIELDKVAGEPVDLLANGKLIAKGEVVVIEDNFGLRITSIISPADRLKNL